MSRNQRFRDAAVTRHWQREVELGRKVPLPTRLPVNWYMNADLWSPHRATGGTDVPFDLRWHYLCIVQEACRGCAYDGRISRRRAEQALDVMVIDDADRIIGQLESYDLLWQSDDDPNVLEIYYFEQYLPSAKELRPEISPSLRASVYARDGRRCLACGSTDDLTLDHVAPYAHGGVDSVGNFQTLCRPCNSSKGTKVIDYRPVLNRPGWRAAVAQEDVGCIHCKCTVVTEEAAVTNGMEWLCAACAEPGNRDGSAA